MNSHPSLSAFQIEVIRLFFTLPESDGFLLAGGAALAATGLTARPTQDIDLFTSRADVQFARDALTAAASARDWGVTLVRSSPTFCRLVLHGPSEDLLVDLARDSEPRMPPAATFAGPTFAGEELAGRKLLALFDRAAARDFADIFTLTATFPPERLIEVAADVDPGMNEAVLAQMFQTLARFSDEDIPVAKSQVATLRAFFAAWAHDLRE